MRRHIGKGLSLALFGAAFGGFVQAEPLISNVGVDGKFLPLKPGHPPSVTVPFGVKDVRFHFESLQKADSAGTRVRYKLEGVDDTWRDPMGEMCIRVRLGDASGNPVCGSRVVFSGETQGWLGHPESAPLQKKTLTLTAPEAATTLELSFISNGGHGHVGSMVVDNVKVRITGDATPGAVIDLDLQTGEHLELSLIHI
jgi:hypothetical protein